MVREREYLFSVDNFNKPIVYTGKKAIGLLLTRLILLKPGSDPLHPEMGVGIENYRYAMGKIEELRDRIKTQIQTYLPDFQSADVTLVATPDHLLNIEITINDTIYVYDSTEAPVAITIDSAKTTA
jgi:hypothetical protein